MASLTFRKRARFVAAASMAAWLFNSPAAAAADLYVLSAAAMQPVLHEIAGDFERWSGHRVHIRYASLEVFTRTLPDETIDVVISSRQFISDLGLQGRIRPDVQLTICKIGMGIVVPSGTAQPRVASIADFKRTLLEAGIVVYADPAAGGAAGIHVARVIEQLGMADKVKAKTIFAGDITKATVAAGTGAVGITQISDIVGKTGAALAGPLPNELQNYTIVSAAIHRYAPQSEAVGAFMAFLTSAKAAAVIKQKGMEVD